MKARPIVLARAPKALPSISNEKAEKQEHKLNYFIEIIDKNDNWNDQPKNVFTQNTAYNIIGVIGKQYCGKSFILSKIADIYNDSHELENHFKSEPLSSRQELVSESRSIRMYISTARNMWIDTRPLLESSTLLNKLNQFKRNMKDINITKTKDIRSGYPIQESEISNFKDIDTNKDFDVRNVQKFFEIKDIQLVTFLTSVCDTILIVDESGNVDQDIMKYLQLSELIRPSLNASLPPSYPEEPNLEKYLTFKEGNNMENGDIKHPHNTLAPLAPNIVYVINKCERILDFEDPNRSRIYKTLDACLEQTSFKYKKRISNDCVDLKNDQKSNNNVVIFPFWSQEEILEPAKKFKSNLYPNDTNMDFYNCTESLKDRIARLPRTAIFRQNALTELQWFDYARKIWEALKISPLINEYKNAIF
ncbi:nonsense-mediated mRNA decay factor SMG9-like isoform X2 [Gordionus sp. m RMFG-2023]|uniref:nonsense-mediated mRNA decay factor SMG9-like isoform X2 n=1 Tax=Gordionus sp. m RMFG-2023 TaxID=3053472 RepID=UPI0031FCF218